MTQVDPPFGWAAWTWAPGAAVRERRGLALAGSDRAAARAAFRDAAVSDRSWGATRKADELILLAERDATAV